TPLAAILGYAELMQEGFYEPLGQKSLDALTRIRSNGNHLLGLINTVLDIAKIESGQFTLNMSEYAIESVVETVRSATESLAQNKKLALKTEVAKSLPIGLGDEQRLTQVLLNLVGNAIKFTDCGEVRVTAKAVNGQFNVSVTDTGPGIPAEHQTRIFHIVLTELPCRGFPVFTSESIRTNSILLRTNLARACNGTPVDPPLCVHLHRDL